MGSDRVDHILRIAISGGAPTKFTKKLARTKLQVDLTSAPPIKHLHGNCNKQPKSRHRNNQVRTCKSDSLPTSKRLGNGFPPRPTNSAPQTHKKTVIKGNTSSKCLFPKINTLVHENIHGLTTAQLAHRDMPNGKNWAKQMAGHQEAYRFLRADSSNDKLVIRKQKPEKTNLEIIQSPYHEEPNQQNSSAEHKKNYKLNLSNVTPKIDTGQTTKKTASSSRISVYSYDHMSSQRNKVVVTAKRMAWKKLIKKQKKEMQIFSQNNLKTERKLQGVYANREYKIQRQARVLKRVEDVQYNQVRDYNEDTNKRELSRTHSILAQREHLKLVRDRFDAEQVKRFKHQYVSWKSVETDRLARGSDIYGLPNNIYTDRYSKELQPVTTKPPPKKTFKAVATRVRNIQRFQLILNPNSTSDPDKLKKGSEKLLIEGIDTIHLPSTDEKEHKQKKPVKVRSVIGSARRLISENNIDTITESSDEEWEELSSLEISDEDS